MQNICTQIIFQGLKLAFIRKLFFHMHAPNAHTNKYTGKTMQTAVTIVVFNDLSKIKNDGQQIPLEYGQEGQEVGHKPKPRQREMPVICWN